jgi:hypothetical protein
MSVVADAVESRIQIENGGDKFSATMRAALDDLRLKLHKVPPRHVPLQEFTNAGRSLSPRRSFSGGLAALRNNRALGAPEERLPETELSCVPRAVVDEVPRGHRPTLRSMVHQALGPRDGFVEQWRCDRLMLEAAGARERFSDRR